MFDAFNLGRLHSLRADRGERKSFCVWCDRLFLEAISKFERHPSRLVGFPEKVNFETGSIHSTQSLIDTGENMAGILASKFQRIKWSIKYRGCFNFFTNSALRLIPKVKSSSWFARHQEQQFDRRYGVETSSDVAVQDLDISDGERTHAVEYAPTYGVTFSLLLERLEIDYSDYAFVDYGCGKGRVLLLASEFPFREIVGVELSESLCEIAAENVKTYNSKSKKCDQIECLKTDATAYDIPKRPALLFFFNPFDDHILAKVLDQIHQSLDEQPRDVMVVYSNPVHKRLFDESDRWKNKILPAGFSSDTWAIYQAVQ